MYIQYSVFRISEMGIVYIFLKFKRRASIKNMTL